MARRTCTATRRRAVCLPTKRRSTACVCPTDAWFNASSLRVAVSGLVPCQGLISTAAGCNSGGQFFPNRYRGAQWQSVGGAPLNGLFSLSRGQGAGGYETANFGSVRTLRNPDTAGDDCDCVDRPTSSLVYSNARWRAAVNQLQQPGQPPLCRLILTLQWFWDVNPDLLITGWSWMASGFTSTLITDFVPAILSGSTWVPDLREGCFTACGPLSKRGHQSGVAISVEAIP